MDPLRNPSGPLMTPWETTRALDLLLNVIDTQLLRHATSSPAHDTQLRSACRYCFSHNTQRSAYCCLLLLLRGLVSTSALHIAIYFFSYEDRHNKTALDLLLNVIDTQLLRHETSSPAHATYKTRNFYGTQLLRHATSSSTRNTQRWTFFSTSSTRNFYDTQLLLPRTQLIRHATSTTRNFFSHARHLALCILLLLLPRHSTLCILLLLIPRHAARCLLYDTLCFLYDTQLPRHATTTTRNFFSHARHLALCILLLLLPRHSTLCILLLLLPRTQRSACRYCFSHDTQHSAYCCLLLFLRGLVTTSALHIAIYFFSYEDRHNKAALCLLLLLLA